jgi:hypothetical protein
MQLTDVIQWIHSTRQSGTLTVSVDLEDTHLVFKQGEVTAVGTDDPLRLDLGQTLLARGAINEAQLVYALRRTDSDRSVVDVLVESGALDADDVSRYQVEHIFDYALDLFLHQEGSFLFSPAASSHQLLFPTEIPAENLLTHPISTQQLLLDAMRQLDEWQRIQAAFPNPYVIVHALEGMSDNPVWRELRRAAGLLSVGELILHVGRSRFFVYKLLYEAYQSGLIVMDEQSSMPVDTTRDEPVEMLLRNARILVEEHQHEEAREVLATVLHVEPDNREARKLLTDLRAEYLASLYQQVPPHRVPVLALDPDALAGLDLTPRESYLASRLDGSWDVASLVVANPLSELDTLRTLRKFLHAGIARLKD